MDEREWLACTSPRRMLKYLWATGSDRKLRLFAVACARRVCHLAPSEQNERLEVAERFADGTGSVEELEASWDVGLNSRVLGAAPAPWRAEDFADAAAGDACDRHAADAATWAMEDAQEAADPEARTDMYGEIPEGTEHHPQVSLLRDVFGNPFRPVTINPAWRTPAVLALAQAAHDIRALPTGTLDPDRLAILADALEKAGCTNADILGHLRGPGRHVRGCWVLDTLLDKS